MKVRCHGSEVAKLIGRSGANKISSAIFMEKAIRGLRLSKGFGGCEVVRSLGFGFLWGGGGSLVELLDFADPRASQRRER